MSDKIMSVQDALSLISDGDTVAVGGLWAMPILKS